MAVFLSQRWNRAPTHPVGVNWNHPLAQGLCHAVYNGKFDSARGVVLDAGVNIGVSRHGTKFRTNVPYFQHADSENRTIIAKIEATSSLSGYNGAVSAGWYASGADCQDLGIGVGELGTGGADLYAFNRNNADGVTTLLTNPTYPFTYTVGISAAVNLYGTAYLDGIAYATVPCTGTGTYTRDTRKRLEIAVNETTDTVYFYYAFYWNKELAPPEHYEIYLNPWQLFAPVQRRLYFGVGAATAYTLTAATGTFTETGNAAALLRGNVLLTTTGAFTETGNAANLVKTSVLATAVGAFTETGNDANLTKQWALVADVASFVLTGNDVTLNYSGNTHPPLAAGTGSYTLTGNAAGLAHGWVLTTEVGTFVETGNAANLKVGNALVTETGAFTLTGNDAALTKTYVLTTEVGVFTMTGRAASLIWSGAGGSTVEFFRGVSKAPDGGVSKTIHTLVDGGGGTYVVTESSGVSEDKTDSPNYEGYIIT